MSVVDYNVLKQLTRIADSLEKIERKLPEQQILTGNGMRGRLGLEKVWTRQNMINDMMVNPYVRYTHPNFSSDEYIYTKEDGRIFTEEGYLFEDWTSEGPGKHNGMRMRAGGSWEDGWTRYSDEEKEIRNGIRD